MFKIIISPQVANYLLQKRFRINNLKPKKGAPNETVFVFVVEDGFYEALESFKEN